MAGCLILCEEQPQYAEQVGDRLMSYCMIKVGRLAAWHL